jgi:hypothetical protein
MNKEFFILQKKLNWFIDGIGIHCILWDHFKNLTPEWIVEHYNVEMSYFEIIKN